MNLDDLTSYLGDANVKAFLRVIREGESNQNDDAYTLVYGGGHFTGFARHPFDGIPTTQGGKACGAYQFLGTTWKAIREQYGISGFSPAEQDCGAVGDIVNHGALQMVMAGDLQGAINKLAKEWISLPGLGPRAQKVFEQFGGVLHVVAEPPTTTAPPIPAPTQGSPMPLLVLLQIFGPILAQLIPQVARIINPKPTEVAARNLDAAQVVLDTVVKAAGLPLPPTDHANAGQIATAVEAMQADKKLATNVQQAVVTEPTIMAVLEVGQGGIRAAREAGLAAQVAERPYWYNPVFVISAFFFPMMYMIVGAVLFTVHADVDDVTKIPFWAQVGFDQATRSGLVNLIVGMVFGGVVGVWFGTSYGSQRKTEIAASATKDATAAASGTPVTTTVIEGQ